MNPHSLAPARKCWTLVVLCGAALLFASGVSVSAQTILQGWEGIAGPTGAVPPDPHGAPGPNGVLATVNLQIAYYTKAGAITWGPVTLPNF